jgi:hypothetical protein
MDQGVIATRKAYYFHQAYMEKMSFRQVRQNFEGLLVLIQHFEGG